MCAFECVHVCVHVCACVQMHVCVRAYMCLFEKVRSCLSQIYPLSSQNWHHWNWNLMSSLGSCVCACVRVFVWYSDRKSLRADWEILLGNQAFGWGAMYRGSIWLVKQRNEWEEKVEHFCKNIPEAHRGCVSNCNFIKEVSSIFHKNTNSHWERYDGCC